MDFRVSYNLRGLATQEQRNRMKLFISGLPTSPALFYGQEHKLRRNNIQWLHSLWPSAEFIIAPTKDGTNARRNNRVPIGCGGAFLVVGPQLKDFIMAKGVLASERAAWAHLDHPNLGRLGVISIYAPNKSKLRKALWNELAETLDSSHTWVVAGDFNMVKNAPDRRGGSGRILDGAEKRAWKLVLYANYAWKILFNTEGVTYFTTGIIRNGSDTILSFRMALDWGIVSSNESTESIPPSPCIVRPSLRHLRLCLDILCPTTLLCQPRYTLSGRDRDLHFIE